ncbi:MAG: glutathione S-transferase [Pelagibacteraceae bacterium]|nr:glutathione S-transferase [Pelagibacteraceae bacterium]|tara:strand:+ start:57212 stop:57835 length:624 start_codon:yes stop_codon:yes gene_type:complete
MIDLYTAPTPNGRKVSILLEELDIDYNPIWININKDEQFSKEFELISPSNKIPAIVDKENNKSIFESGAILLYLAKKYKKFIPSKYKWQTMEWFFFQISQVGPFLGQAHQFLYYNPGKSPYTEEKYRNYVKRVYETLDTRLKKNSYLAIEYSIADIATWPWIARFEIHEINLKNYPNVLNWYKLIAKRAAVIKGYNSVGEKISIPMI